MERTRSIDTLRAAAAGWREQGARIVLVPTMGGLHEGHMRLVDVGRRLGDRLVVSLFVNPMQFGPQEDFEAYPRDEQGDTERLAAASVDLLFAPDRGTLYPRGTAAATRIYVPGLSDILCGASRPGHFTGVATVVAKLFNLVMPDVAVFGEKDYQQLLVVHRMAADLAFPLEIATVPTVRDRDGVALSSRNRYLSDDERRRAPALYQALQEAAQALATPPGDVGAIERQGRARLEQAGFRPDYFAVRRAEDLAPPQRGDMDLVVLAAAWLGRARLIDNVRVGLARTGTLA